MWGGGNSLNIIRVPSLNEANSIIFKSDLNGNITPGNMNTWQIYNTWAPWWNQNNSNDVAYIRALRADFLESVNKNDTLKSNWDGPICFYPVIEFKE